LGLTQKLTPRWTISALWSYASGNAVSFPTGKITLEGQTFAIYSNKNGQRMPANHHLDFSATLKAKTNKRFQSEWNFSVYNVYARKNPWIYSFRESTAEEGQLQAVKLYLYSIVPTINYNFKFK